MTLSRQPLPSYLTRIALLVSLSVPLLARAPVAFGNDDRRSVVTWTPRTAVQQPLRFRIEFEESQTFRALDFQGRPVTKKPDASLVRALSALVVWEWKRVQADSLEAEVTLERVERVELSPGNAATAAVSGVKIGIRFSRKDGKVKAQLRRSELARLDNLFKEDLTRGKSAKSGTARREFKQLIEDVIADLLGFFPPTARAAPVKLGQKWTLPERRRTLLQKTTLVETCELEIVRTEKKDREDRLRIEGAIRQRLDGAPPDVQRAPGLFPGTITWTHDVQKGFPVRFVAKKTAKIPIADERLPIVRTLVHEYVLRFGLAEGK